MTPFAITLDAPWGPLPFKCIRVRVWGTKATVQIIWSVRHTATTVQSTCRQPLIRAKLKMQQENCGIQNYVGAHNLTLKEGQSRPQSPNLAKQLPTERIRGHTV